MERKKIVTIMTLVAIVTPMLFTMSFLPQARATTIQTSAKNSSYAIQWDLLGNLSTTYAKWKAHLALDANGKAMITWANLRTTSLDFRFDVQFTENVGDFYALGNYDAWSTSAATTLASNIHQGLANGFIDSAIDTDGNLVILYSNVTDFGNNMFETWLLTYNSTSASIASNVKIQTEISKNWSSVPKPDWMNLYERPASAKLLIDANNKPVAAWNNGTSLYFYTVGEPVVKIDDAGASGIMGACDMLFAPNGTLIVLYAKGSAGANSKEIYMRQSVSANYSAFGSIKSVYSGDSTENCVPAGAFDASGDLNVVWATRVQGDPKVNYTIQYKKIGGTARTISNDYGTYASTTISNQNGKMAYFPDIAFANGDLHIIYSDTSLVDSNADFDVFWQLFDDPANMTNNELTVIGLSDAANAQDAFPEIYNSPGDDLFFSWYFYEANALDYGNASRMRIAKVDYKAPVVTFSGALSWADTETSQSIAQPSTLNVVFTSEEIDIKSVAVTWDGAALATTLATTQNITVIGQFLSLGVQHTVVIAVTDELNNVFTRTLSITFTGIDPMVILVLLVVGACAALVIVLAVFFQKNKQKLAKRGLGLKLAGKESDSWSEEGGDEEDESPKLDDATKLDMKKVDK